MVLIEPPELCKMMSQEELEKYVEAGKILCEVLSFSRKIVVPGASLVDIAEKIERKIVDLGGKPAFPTNISINHVAAHFTPNLNEKARFSNGDLVKIDCGVHVEGYIADAAYTVSFSGEHDDLIAASEEALNSAIKVIRDGVRTSEVGRVIENKIKSYGFNPIRNLTGHKLERFRLHGGINVPNVGSFRGKKMRRGEVYAVEPFSTNGEGYVEESSIIRIYRSVSRETKLKDNVLNFILNEYGSFPFALRWLQRSFKEEELNKKVKKLLLKGLLYPYPVLIEKSRGLVAQCEKTLVVEGDGCYVLT